MFTPTCHLDPMNSTPIWNYLAWAQHMPFLCPHITGLTSYGCVQKSFRISRFSFSYVLRSRAAKLLTLLQICSFVPFLSSPLKWVSLLALGQCLTEVNACIKGWMIKMFSFTSPVGPPAFCSQDVVWVLQCVLGAAAAADLCAFLSF